MAASECRKVRWHEESAAAQPGVVQGGGHRSCDVPRSQDPCALRPRVFLKFCTISALRSSQLSRGIDAAMASADFSPVSPERSPQVSSGSFAPCRPALLRTSLMTFGLCRCSPTRRPCEASLPVRIPAVAAVPSPSFSFASRLRLGVRLGLASSPPSGTFQPDRSQSMLGTRTPTSMSA